LLVGAEVDAEIRSGDGAAERPRQARAAAA